MALSCVMALWATMSETLAGHLPSPYRQNSTLHAMLNSTVEPVPSRESLLLSPSEGRGKG